MKKPSISFKSLLFLSLLTLSSFAFAKTIDLREQPKDKSKIVGKIDTTTGMITIFTPQNSKWIKVADPRNGDVGWIKTSEVDNADFHFNLFTTGDKKNGYRVLQYGGTQPYTDKQINDMMKNMRKHQEKLQHDMQHMMNDMFMDFDHFPVLMPVIINPEKTEKPKETKKK